MKKLLPLLLLPLFLCAEGLTDSFNPELSNETKELTEIKPKKNSF